MVVFHKLNRTAQSSRLRLWLHTSRLKTGSLNANTYSASSSMYRIH